MTKIGTGTPAAIKTAAMTASSAAAAAAGEHVLRAGGNAVDAAVATAFASCVADPCNTGLGGFGGHMIVLPASSAADRTPVCIDFNAWAPLSAVATYRRVAGPGAAASVIPNAIAGLSCALDAYGTMPWQTVLQPAIVLAEDGFACGPTLARALEDVHGEDFVDDCFRFEHDIARPDATTRLRQPALAATLRQLSDHGPDWFYKGPIATLGSDALRAAGHDITTAQWADAINAVTAAPAPMLRIGAADIYSSPLGTSGSLSLFAIAKAACDIARSGELDSPAGIVRLAQQMASAWSFRFGDPAGNAVTQSSLETWIERAIAQELATSPALATLPGSGHTCHLNAADRNGMMAAATFTHGKLWFGARWALPGTGVIMNYGSPAFTDAAPQASDGRARGVTNMNPTIARLDDGATLAVGTPGARRISSIVGLVLARHIEARMPLPAAIASGRFHAEDRSRATLEPDRLSGAVASALRNAFARVEAEGPVDYYGPCNAIRRDATGAITLGLDDRWPGFGAAL